MNKTRSIIVYFCLAFGISWLLWIPSVLQTAGVAMPDILLLISQFALLGPMIASLILLGLTEGKTGIRRLFISAVRFRFNKIWLIAIVGLPAVLVITSYVIKLAIENQVFQLTETPMLWPLFIIVLFFAGGPLEEFGWRGFALPRLMEKTSLLAATLILGLLHGLWHLPLHFMDGTVQSVMPFWQFVLVTLVGSVIYGWIFAHTKYALSAMILHHWSTNLASALIVYWDTNLGRWVFFGLQLLLAMVLVIFDRRIFTRKHTAGPVNSAANEPAV